MNKLFSGAAQGAMQGLAWVDRHWDNLVVDIDNEDPTWEPYEFIEKLRLKDNILRSYLINGWYVLSHEDVRELYRDKRLGNEIFSNSVAQMVIRGSSRGLFVPSLETPHMLNMDAPEHTRLRRLVSQSFTNRFVQSLAPKIDALAEDLLKTTDNENVFDVVDVLAKPLPAIVIAEMLGVPVEERHLFEKWSADLLGYTELMDPGKMQAAIEADLGMRIYLQELTDYKREHPDEGLICKMIEAEEDGDRLTLDELYATCMLVLVAGHETTTRLIGSCLLLLLQHPEQLHAVREDRVLMKNAIEEALRFEPPVLAVGRLVKETFEYKGHKFRKGQMILLSIAGANRDPGVTPNPGDFDIHREQFDHISFGHGIHLCLGMPLARMEAEIALNKLLDKFPNLSLPEQPLLWERNPFFRGLERLEVAVATG